MSGGYGGSLGTTPMRTGTPGGLIPVQNGNLNGSFRGGMDAQDAILLRLAAVKESAWLRIGSLRMMMGEKDGAQEAYETALQYNPNSIVAMTQIGAVLAKKEMYVEAAQYLQQAITADPYCGEAWAVLAHCYVIADDLHKAYQAYQNALSHLQNPKDPNLWYGIGLLYDRYGSLEHALEAFLAVLNIAPDFERIDEVCFCIGIIYKDQGQYDKALELFHRVIIADLPPSPLTKADTWYQIGSVNEMKKDFKLARDAYRRAIEENPKHSKTLQQLGWLEHQQNNSEEALVLLRKSVETNPSDAQSWYLLGRVHMALREFRQAYDAYQQAVNLNGRNPTFWCSIGVLYYQMAQYRDAMDAYSRAIRLNPYVSEVWYDLGTLYESCNQMSDAIDAYRRAAELAPDSPQILQRLQVLEEASVSKKNGAPAVPPPQPQGIPASLDTFRKQPDQSKTDGGAAAGQQMSHPGFFSQFNEGGASAGLAGRNNSYQQDPRQMQSPAGLSGNQRAASGEFLAAKGGKSTEKEARTSAQKSDRPRGRPPSDPKPGSRPFDSASQDDRPLDRMDASGPKSFSFGAGGGKAQEKSEKPMKGSSFATGLPKPPGQLKSSEHDKELPMEHQREIGRDFERESVLEKEKAERSAEYQRQADREQHDAFERERMAQRDEARQKELQRERQAQMEREAEEERELSVLRERQAQRSRELEAARLRDAMEEREREIFRKRAADRAAEGAGGSFTSKPFEVTKSPEGGQEEQPEVRHFSQSDAESKLGSTTLPQNKEAEHGLAAKHDSAAAMPSSTPDQTKISNASEADKGESIPVAAEDSTEKATEQLKETAGPLESEQKTAVPVSPTKASEAIESEIMAVEQASLPRPTPLQHEERLAADASLDESIRLRTQLSKDEDLRPLGGERKSSPVLSERVDNKRSRDFEVDADRDYKIPRKQNNSSSVPLPSENPDEEGALQKTEELMADESKAAPEAPESTADAQEAEKPSDAPAEPAAQQSDVMKSAGGSFGWKTTQPVMFSSGGVGPSSTPSGSSPGAEGEADNLPNKPEEESDEEKKRAPEKLKVTRVSTSDTDEEDGEIVD
eukprot:CAMPEP_0182443732 /NCGR_PEP_ID=MMETSP1172-20130603/2380_1 /TAXON_ID=708627 /ORGANISM="Timspurckia oligopyrenoides, Strain CCMP3278" /LENGTH=1082 /DNA_ID=CAMNT_0024639093 /DNA_START=169 /DNA_END=3417 /DNA_ORIENTATION=+